MYTLLVLLQEILQFLKASLSSNITPKEPQHSPITKNQTVF